MKPKKRTRKENPRTAFLISLEETVNSLLVEVASETMMTE